LNDVKSRTLAHLQASFEIAEQCWGSAPLAPTAEAFQATVATTLIHMTELAMRDRQQSSQPAGRAVPGSAPGRPAPSPVPPCPKCGGEAWDNRAPEKKKTPKSPDFRCKNQQCGTEKDGEFRVTAWWVDRPKANNKPAKAPDFNKVPKPIAAGIAEDDDELPF
jgi:hypothetical protein